MVLYRVIITPRAGADLEAIHDHIAMESPASARLMIERILDALEPLRQFPHRTIVERQGTRLRYPVRSIVVLPYLIYFRALDEDKVIRVLHVRHGARRRPPTIRLNWSKCGNATPQSCGPSGTRRNLERICSTSA